MKTEVTVQKKTERDALPVPSSVNELGTVFAWVLLSSREDIQTNPNPRNHTVDIYERLKQDHDRHRELATKIEATSGDSEERRRLWNEFKPDAVAHANAEEQTFYAALIEEPEGQEKARHSVHEHKKADDLLTELEEMDMSNGGWLQKFGKLKEELEHHMDEEENEVFARAKKLLSDETARSLATKFEERKTQEA